MFMVSAVGVGDHFTRICLGLHIVMYGCLHTDSGTDDSLPQWAIIVIALVAVVIFVVIVVGVLGLALSILTRSR